MIEAEARDRLRQAFARMRDRANSLATEIARDLPDYTVHDITHLDALWDYAALVAGPEYPLTPLEVFILGGAILAHDIAMGSAARRDGVESIYTSPLWPLACDLFVPENLRDRPREEWPEGPIRAARGFVLRETHAAFAEELPSIEWTSETGSFHFIDDPELRAMFGQLIGRIAHSHWWSFAECRRKFTTTLGSFPGFPNDWIINPLKVAAIVRAADAAQIDARRAPVFLRLIRRVRGISHQHWLFQSRLLLPVIEVDRLRYSSAIGFTIDEAPSWWLSYDTIRMIDSELAEIDAVAVAMPSLPRFQARGVIGASDPALFSALVPAADWLPVDASLRIDDIPDLIERLGGRHLYGANYQLAALRELLQNGSDAISVLELLQPESIGAGKLVIGRTKQADSQHDRLEIADNGVGMSQRVAVEALLSFGKSLWRSELLRKELPQLQTAKIPVAGQFGIGFFSCFTIANAVTVYTKRYDHSVDEGVALEFRNGITARPLLRRSRAGEAPWPSGTRVALALSESISLYHGQPIGGESGQEPVLRMLYWIAALSRYSVEFRDLGIDHTISRGIDWRVVPDEELVSHLLVSAGPQHESSLRRFAPNLRSLYSHDGTIAGRAAISAYEDFSEVPYGMLISDAGIRMGSSTSFVGVMLGRPTRASRDEAVPAIDRLEMQRWANDQRSLLEAMGMQDEAASNVAEVLRAMQVPTGTLHIVYVAERWICYAELVSWLRQRDYCIIVQDSYYFLQKRYGGSACPGPNVVISEVGYRSVYGHDLDAFLGGGEGHSLAWFDRCTIAGLIQEAAQDAWGLTADELSAASLGVSQDREHEAVIGQRGPDPITYDNSTILRRSQDISVAEIVSGVL